MLLVSHDPGAVKSLCDRAILMDMGRIILDGAPDTVLDYYNGLIAAEQLAIAAERAALTVATAALDVALRALEAARSVLVTTPIDLDPRVGPLLVAREVPQEVLRKLLAAMPEIPEIPGTIEATAGFRVDGDGLIAEARATYCDNGVCTEIRGGSDDREAGRACITLPGYGGKRVCTAVPAEPT